MEKVWMAVGWLLALWSWRLRQCYCITVRLIYLPSGTPGKLKKMRARKKASNREQEACKRRFQATLFTGC